MAINKGVQIMIASLLERFVTPEQVEQAFAGVSELVALAKSFDGRMKAIEERLTVIQQTIIERTGETEPGGYGLATDPRFLDGEHNGGSNRTNGRGTH